jgi:glycosyltransferase involved in cell wall biosynthesis
MIRIAHVITDLTMGGAEQMLLRLLGVVDRTRFQPQVISLKQTHPVGDWIAERGVPVRALGMRGFDPRAIARLASWLRADRVDVVQTWMLHANVAGLLAAQLAGRIPVAWGIHVGKLDRATHGAATVLIQRLSVPLARMATTIVCCSETSRTELEAIGYPPARMQVIPNGFDLGKFRPDEEARRSVRRELGLADDAQLVGWIGRAHPQKDLRTLGAAVERVMRQRPDVRFVLCGRGVTPDNAELRQWLGSAAEHAFILGERHDVPRLTAAFDVACSSSSYGEAFPLVLGEAMASGVPCVTTDCGDAARILGGLGRVVPIRDPEAFARALLEILSLPPDEWRTLGAASRQRIESEYSLSAISNRYAEVHAALGSLR